MEWLTLWFTEVIKLSERNSLVVPKPNIFISLSIFSFHSGHKCHFFPFSNIFFTYLFLYPISNFFYTAPLSLTSLSIKFLMSHWRCSPMQLKSPSFCWNRSTWHALIQWDGFMYLLRANSRLERPTAYLGSPFSIK